MKIVFNRSLMFDNVMYAAGEELEMDETTAKKLADTFLVTIKAKKGETEASKEVEVSTTAAKVEKRETKPLKAGKLEKK